MTWAWGGGVCAGRFLRGGGGWGGGDSTNVRIFLNKKRPLEIKKRYQGKVLGDLKKANASYSLTSKLGFAYGFDIDGQLLYKIGCEVFLRLSQKN